MCVPIVACSKKDNDSESVQNTVQAGSVGEGEYAYEYPELDYGGKDFVFLNVLEDLWGMHTGLAFEKLDGVVLNEAIYKRNTALKEIFNVNIAVQNVDITQTSAELQRLISAGEDTIDAAFCGGDQVATLIGSSALVDMNSIETMNMDKKWWNQNIIADSKLGNSSAIYYALSEISFTGFDLTWSVMFNPEIVNEHNLDNLYDLVTKNEWTFEKMWEIATVCSDLNGEDDFEYTAGEQSVYGFTSYNNFVAAAMTGYGISMVQKNNQGRYENALVGNQDFSDFAEDYGLNAGTPGMFLSINSSTRGNYRDVFKEGRAAFVGAEIKETENFKSMDNYGVLPVPKADIMQDNYYSNTNYLTPLLVIPNTNVDLVETGIILDAMAYMSHTEVLPVYYETTLSLKNMKDPDSIEMLDIIRDSRTFDISLIYGWTTKMYEDFRNQLDQGNYYISSVIGKYTESVSKNIASTYELFGQ